MFPSLRFSSVSLSFLSCFFSRAEDLNFRILISLRLATSQFQSLKNKNKPKFLRENVRLKYSYSSQTQQKIIIFDTFLQKKKKKSGFSLEKFTIYFAKSEKTLFRRDAMVKSGGTKLKIFTLKKFWVQFATMLCK